MELKFQSPVRFSKTGQKTDSREKAVVDGSALDSWDHLNRFTSAVSDDGLQVSDYREMMRLDAQIAAAVNLKIMARLSSGWIVEPASDSPEDEKVATFINDQFNNMDGSFYKFLRDAMLSMAYGHTFHEIVLRPVINGEWDGYIGLRALKWKRPDQMRVRTDKFGNVTSVEQLVENEWKPLDHRYFCFHAWDHEGDYVGKSQLRAAYRWYKAKKLIDTFWNVYLEKYAMPTPIGKHPPGLDEASKQEMLRFITNVNGKRGAVFPKNWEVEFLEAMRSGGSSGYEEKVKYCDKMIARSLHIPTLLFDEGESGAYALGQQHAKNFEWVLEALGDEFASGLIQDQLIKFLVELNFDVDKLPTFRFKPFTPVELDKLAQAYSTLIDKGVVSHEESFIRERLELPPLEDGVDQPTPLGASPSTPPLEDGDGAHGDGDPMNRPETRKPEGSPVATKLSAWEGSEPIDVAEFASRTPRAASKFKHREVKVRLEDAEEEAVSSLASVAQEMHGSILRQLRGKKIVANRDLKAVEAMRIPAGSVKEFRNTVEQLYGNALHMGAQDAVDEIRRGGYKGDVPGSMGFNLSGEPVDDEWQFSQREIIDFWESKAPIQRELLRVYSREAFTVSGVFRDDVLEGAQRVIAKGLRRGASAAQIEADLSAFFGPYVGGSVSAKVVDPYRIRTIVRTSLSEAYNTGRMNVFRSPGIAEDIVAFSYSAILDRNTTPFCREWHGTVLRADDYRVSVFNPPNHFNCRSVWVPILRGETFTLTDDDGLSGRQPQDGFLGCAHERANKE